MLIQDVKPYLLKPVFYENTKYILKECILWLNPKEEKFEYSLILLDRNNHSTIRASLHRVSVERRGSDE